ncbi:11933_t:CDS:2 [Ambispora leptoticha]|uniref:11933_t:CDS:1 n=1 Tax=Ambispora leptoticha TaxID=144679 RepID=A0A9N9GXP0_9GLOM|nr:11933_t:CDS:2 [Ambispora leptoticha]
MSPPTLLICSALAVFCGFLAHQTVETLMNTALTFLPLNIRTKIKKTKNQVIVVPTTQKTTVKVKSPKTSNKLRSTRSKTDTLAYYNCLIDQIASPVNAKVKITSLAHHCKCNKGKVEAARQEHKAQLVKEVAKNYQAFGESLGHYLHADIVGCVKELKK